MDDNSATHAMTEIALALAMAFFALMILTLVSMGAGNSDSEPSNISALDVTAPVPENTAASRAVQQDDLILIHNGQTFLTPTMDVIPDPQVGARIAQHDRVILAVPPTLTFEQTLSIRTTIGDANTIVTPLTPEWMVRLGLK